MSRRASAPIAVSLLAGLLAAAGSWFNWFAALDKAWYDLSIRNHTLGYPQDIVIVAIDESSLDALGAWPWDRSRHARLLERLPEARAVVFDLLFAEPQSSAIKPVNPTPDSAALSADGTLANALRIHSKALLPIFIEQQQYRGLMQEVLPIPELAAAAAALGHAHVEYEKDGIARGIYLRMGLGKAYWPHLALALADLNRDLSEDQRRTWGDVGSQGSPYQIYSAHFARLRFAGPPRTIYRFSYIDVLSGRVPAAALQDKVVYVGATATGLGDDVPTPFGAMPGVELHANAYHALRSDAFIETFSEKNTALLQGLLAFFASLLLSRLPPRTFLFATILMLLVYAAAVTALFFIGSRWVAPTPFIAALLFFYPLWSWRRIEIAMNFLRGELAELQGRPGEYAPNPEQLRESLETLVNLGLFRSAAIEAVPGDGGGALWPAVDFAGNTLRSSFSLDEKFYAIRVESDNHEDSVATLNCLLEDLPGRRDTGDDSYELVEKTIAEIYATRKVVERTRDRMNQSMARLQDVVIVSDIAGRIIFVNDSGSIYFEPGLAGKSVLALSGHIDKNIWQAIVRNVMVEGEQVYREVETGDGSLLLCQAARLHETEVSRDTLLFVFTDVTQLRALEQGKNEALAFLSHDMRSPLVSQLALIENYRRDQLPDTIQDAQAPLLDKLVFFAERSLKYSEDFLQLARAENLDQEKFQLVDLHGVVDAALAEVAGLAMQHGVRLEIVRTPEDCWAEGDAQLLERTVSNLLSNAIQHSPRDQLVTVTLQAGDRLAIAVADNGAGIDAEALPHLFKPYFRARRSSVSNSVEETRGVTEPADQQPGGHSRNYGLGLSFVHSVIERHGGQIDVQSSIGKGTCITLYLPKTELD
ncbi:MAG: CHASE2 domain-containing protein [Pseudomonadales bacterium]|nr:CHASE2 domain-containing protein [Pseudomonadales bacterium]